jgi:hypothetical protein
MVIQINKNSSIKNSYQSISKIGIKKIRFGYPNILKIVLLKIVFEIFQK